MLGIYFSGTGNTKRCVERLVKNLDQKANILSIEEEQVIENIKNEEDLIVLGYSIQYSNIPLYVREFLEKNGKYFSGKKVFLMATMGLFSGDGTGCAARVLKKYNVNIVGGLHVIMPDSILDVKALKKTPEENENIIHRAEEKIDQVTKQINQGNYPKDGLGVASHLAGLFGQRLWFYGKTKSYCKNVKINEDKCVGCGKCATSCPMHNISMQQGKATALQVCTMCYRCVDNCPVGAIHILGKEKNLPQNIDK